MQLYLKSMTNGFFHLDRLGMVDEDTTFKLQLSNAHPSHAVQELENGGIYEQMGQEEFDFIEEYFGAGLTAHGMNYLYPNFSVSSRVLSEFDGELSVDTAIRILSKTQLAESWRLEIIFELVRRSEYKEDNISRFQSVFGTKCRTNLEKWMRLPHVEASSGDIWRVEPDSFVEKDAGHFIPTKDFDEVTELAEYLIRTAHSYWRGDSADTTVPEVLLTPEVHVVEYVGPVND